MKSFSGISFIAALLFVSGAAQAEQIVAGFRSAPLVYEQSRRASEIREMETQSQNEVQSSEDRTVTTMMEFPGLYPWEALTLKSRMRRAMGRMELIDIPYMKPEIEAKKQRVHYDRLNRSARGTLDGERTGRNKLLKMYYHQ